MNPQTRKKILWAGAFILLPLLYTIILERYGVLAAIENRLLDARQVYFNPGRTFSDRVVVVDVDEGALTNYAAEPLFGRWPWRRAVYPPMLDYINQCGARMILFDVSFTEASRETGDDDALADATLRLPNISHAVQSRRDEFPGPTPPAQILDQARAQVKVTARESARIADFNVLTVPFGSIGLSAPYLHDVSFNADPDGVARRVSPLFKHGEVFFPALALRGYFGLTPQPNAAAVGLGSRSLEIPDLSGTGELRVPLYNGRYVLAYYGVEEMDATARRVSISAVIESVRALEKGEITDFAKLRAPPELFTDKIVIIGTSAAATHDDKVTPFGTRPGFMLHATMLSNLINGDFIRILPPWTGLIGAAVLLLAVVGLAMFTEGTILRVAVPAALLIGAALGGALLFQWTGLAFAMAPGVVSAPVSFLAALGYLTFVEGAEKRRYSKVLKNMVDPTIVNEALHDLDALKKGGEMEITAFFSDIAGFSTISEQLSSQGLAALLNEYLSAMTIILKQHRGTLDKYIGDAIVGIFGAPVAQPNHYLDATLTALDMIEKLEALKVEWKRTGAYTPDAQSMNIRIGLNTGVAKVGFMGTEELASYTMMGDTVNLAARLEAAGKDYGVRILASEFTNAKIQGEVLTRCLDAVVVKGKTAPVKIYEVLGRKGSVAAPLVEARDLYEDGFRLYLARDWDTAIRRFEASRAAKGTPDKSSAMLIERCEEYRASPPPADWNGAFVRTHK